MDDEMTVPLMGTLALANEEQPTNKKDNPIMYNNRLRIRWFSITTYTPAILI
jgi:hypothetical protein